MPYTRAWSGAVVVEATMTEDDITLAIIISTIVFLVCVIIVIERIK